MRRGKLAEALSATEDIGGIATLVGQMFRNYPTINMTAERTREVLVAYVEQLKHLPMWAIEIGCQSCIARNTPFPPSAGELRAACEMATKDFETEMKGLQEVLSAEVFDEPEIPEPTTYFQSYVDEHGVKRWVRPSYELKRQAGLV